MWEVDIKKRNFPLPLTVKEVRPLENIRIYVYKRPNIPEMPHKFRAFHLCSFILNSYPDVLRIL